MDRTGSREPGAAEGGSWIRDTDQQDFVRDVIEASKRVPVLVDFWAEWCGPCKQLGPVLEKLVREAGGAVELVRIDVDRNAELAGQLRIQSLPTVYVFFQGKVLDMFQGALPESQLRGLFEQLKRVAGEGGADGEGAADPVTQALEEAEGLLAQGKHRAARAVLERVVKAVPENLEARSGLIRAILLSGDAKGARVAYDALTEEQRGAPGMVRIAAMLEISDLTGGLEPVDRLEARHAGAPADLQIRFDLARALAREGRFDPAIDHLLAMIAADREWNGQEARLFLLKILGTFPPSDPVVVSARRRLSSILFS